MRKALGYFFFFLALVLFLFVAYSNSRYSEVVRPFSSYSLLNASWENYKKKFINQDGRVLDFSQNEITTSEGQSYALLRAVWIDDKQTFDFVWKWTKTILKRPNDNLFGWKWGKLPDGTTYGFISGDRNSASDADSDIALALILAGRRWLNDQYLQDARKILNDIWLQETATTDGKRYLIAGNWAQNQNEIVVNPSYFSPYAWRIFAQVDPGHDWKSLINPAYDLLEQSGQDPLDKGKNVGLPPDWISIERTTGKVKNTGLDNLTSNYSYDAMRVPWRIAVDYFWSKDPRAKNYLLKSFSFLNDQYQTTGKLASGYTHDGQSLGDFEQPVMYSTVLGYFMLADPGRAKKIYNEKIIGLYSNDTNSFKQDLSYYEQNWLWFGAALFNNKIISYGPPAAPTN